jgi:hypothetical protein
LTLPKTLRDQLIIAVFSSVMISILWVIGDPPLLMNYALAFVITALWVPVLLRQKQREGSILWAVFFGLLGLTVLSIVVRAVWLIGRG